MPDSGLNKKFYVINIASSKTYVEIPICSAVQIEHKGTAGIVRVYNGNASDAGRHSFDMVVGDSPQLFSNGFPISPIYVSTDSDSVCRVIYWL